ncbi:hypothetical protein HGB38_06855 [Nocardia gamkensis]|uniref:Xaa-Pro dipeptidyl-peptidase-like domain-containing protein n=1 Tax=Nocardia gamkensis TaxID=352869 RepID=A0A7X6L1J4_9NOCA|nr:CocE/NonD family hydrolase [Nocardia gamkensis]NKY25939.1 hypothetical protein [Nocardia gamkensis]
MVVQDGRSAEDVLPLSTERADGLATIEWLRDQVWFDGRLALHGMSAIGFAHWAIAADIPELRAVSVHVASSSVADTIFTGGSTALESVLIWCSNHSFITALRAPRRARRAIASGRPAAELDVLTGGRSPPPPPTSSAACPPFGCPPSSWALKTTSKNLPPTPACYTATSTVRNC